jgi:hypothetical protein
MTRIYRLAAPSERLFGAERLRTPGRIYAPVGRAL